MVKTVSGPVTAQYTQKWSLATSPSVGASHLKRGMANNVYHTLVVVTVIEYERRTDTNVAGRKKVPRKAITFIIDPSCLVLAAIRLISSDSRMLVLLSSWAMRLKIWHRVINTADR